MMNNWLKRTICIGTVSLLLAVFLTLSFCLPAQASENERRVLRVAFSQVEGISWTAEDGSRHGIVVDYLNEIAKYTGWEYEYIDTTAETMLSQFQNGAYDLMGGCYYLPGFENVYAYPDYNTGYSRSALLARKDDWSIHSYDLESLNGKTIGVYERATENVRRLKEFLQTNDLNCELKYLEYEDFSENGNFNFFLEQGEVDLLLGNLSDTSDNFRVVASYDSQPFYIVTTPDNQEVLDGLNMALRRILEANPNFAEQCYAANFPDELVDIQLSENDLAYIEQKKSITVALPKDWHPLACPESEQELHPGLVYDLLEQVKAFTGLNFTYVYTEKYIDAVHLVQQGEADLLGFFLGDEEDAEEQGLALSSSYVSMNNILVRNKASNYPDANLVGAAIEGQRLPSDIAAAKVLSYPDTNSALLAVERGEADFIYGLSARLEQEIQRYHFNGLVPATIVNDQSNICLALAKPIDPGLLTILNKAINQLSTDQKSAMLNRNLVSIGETRFSLTDLIYTNPLLFVTVVAGILLVLALAVLLIFRARMKAAVIQGNLEKAEAASRAKGEFLSRMSHEIRTPLNAILGMGAIAMQHLDDTKKVENCLKKLTLSSNHLLALINDVLDMSKIESGKVELRSEPFDFRAYLESLSNLYYGQAKEKGLEYKTVLTGEVDETLVGDSLRLNQILTNLLSNALKFTPAGGSIQLRVSQKVQGSNTVRLHFEVTDTGCGIDEQNYQKIFESFEQEDSSVTNKYGGTGLGLSIVKRFSELMGGSVSVSSRLGEGSTFAVELPFQKTVQPENNTADIVSLKVLAVDDDPDTISYIHSLLHRMGVQVECAENGNLAVSQVRDAHSRQEDFDICFVSCRLPDLDGFETTRRIHEIVPNETTAVLITAYDAAEIEKEAAQSGASGVLAKPLFASTITQTISSLKQEHPLFDSQDSMDADFHGKHLLLVEDNQLNREIAVELLRITGAEVECAKDGIEAVELFSQSPVEHYDLILMDIQMPRMDGLEATRQIRKLDRPDAGSVPIVAMTANAFAEDEHKSKAAGMNAHLSKPLDIKILFAQMKVFLRGDH